MGKFTASFLTHTSEIEVADFRQRLNRSLNSSQGSAENYLGEKICYLAWSCLHSSELLDGGSVVGITQFPHLLGRLTVVVDLQHWILAWQQRVKSAFNVFRPLFTLFIYPRNLAGRERQSTCFLAIGEEAGIFTFFSAGVSQCQLYASHAITSHSLL